MASPTHSLGRRPRARKVLALLALGLLAMAFAGQDARAARIDGGEEFLLIQGSEGAETITVSLNNPSFWHVRVLGNPLTDYERVSGCAFLGAPPFAVNAVNCPRAPQVIATLNRGDDIFTPFDPAGVDAPLDDRLSVNGGVGKDRLYGTARDDSMRGGTGADIIVGGLGEDSISGEGNQDTLRGDDPNQTFVDSDRIDGGTGRDRVLYTDRTLPLTITLAGGADDGQRGGEEGDELIDVEDAEGGAGNDRITGDGSGNRIWGNGGRDVIFGLGGDDTLSGNAGNDALHGNAGDDRLEGWGGRDVLVGGGGRDTMLGGINQDTFSAGPGDDRVFARDNVAEDVNCGTGHDFVRADSADTLHACEDVLHA
jgi:Ca2+-binding RTX toxin-like protein